MTRHETLRRFPNASEAFIRANTTDGAAPSPQPEPAVCNEPVAEKAGKGKDAGRVVLRVVSFRRRLLDPDNLCPKYFVDCVRYSGLIADDREQDIRLEVSQQKVSRKEDERTEITIEPL